MFGRLKQFGRIAARYDRPAINYLVSACLWSFCPQTGHEAGYI